jgi:hypothetical protein
LDEVFKETRSTDVITPTFSDVTSSGNSDIEVAIDGLRQKKFIPPPEIRPVLAQVLENRRVSALLDGDYDTAAECDTLGQVLQAMIQAEEQKRNEDSVIEALYQRWQQLQTQLAEVRGKWDQKLAEFLSATDNQRAFLKDQQDAEVEAFIARWKDPAFLRPYSKPSVKLMQLRDQEKTMGVSRMYGQAKEVRAIADRLQREETQAAQARISAQMASERHKLSEKHGKEIQALCAYRERMIKSIEAEKQKELRPIQTAIQQLKAKKTTPSKRPSSLPSLPSRRAESSCSSSPLAQDGLCSPRTAARYSIFRSERKTTLLDVVPVNDRLLAQMKDPPTARSKSAVTARGLPR